MTRPHPAQLRLLSVLVLMPDRGFVDLVQIERARQVRPGDDLFVPSLVARGWAEMGPRHRASVRITEAGRDTLTFPGACGGGIQIQERKAP